MFKLKIPDSVFAGEHALDALSSLLRPDDRVVVLTDPGIRKVGLTEQILSRIRSSGVSAAVLDQIPPEPAYTDVQRIYQEVNRGGFDTIVAVGGGSVIDTGKLCSIMGCGVTVQDLLEDPSKGRKALRTIMIPTTAGTGAEATPNAIVAVPERQVKIGIVNPCMIPDAAILDPEMIRTLPPSIAAATGVDALCHGIECFTSRIATPFSDLYALEAVKIIFTHLASACLDPDAMDSKAAMLIAAFYGGVAISCSGTTAVHALSYPLGGKYHIPHGIANAVLLLPVMRFNMEYCTERLACVYDVLSMAGAETQEAKAAAVLQRMEALVRQIGIPTDLSAYGVKMDDLEEMVESGMGVQRLLKNNRRPVTADDARMIYRQILC